MKIISAKDLVDQHAEMTTLCSEIGEMLGTMIKNPASLLIVGYHNAFDKKQSGL